jgi:acyl-CoA dehydrogenase
VLARLPDAPAGTRGISLFLVPKFLVNDDGSLGARNDLFCHSLEHKLGIHGSPTCTMIYGDGKFGGAVGWLVGEENKGSGLHVHHDEQCPPCRRHAGRGDRRAATQKAVAYARERTQGRAPGGAAPA